MIKEKEENDKSIANSVPDGAELSFDITQCHNREYRDTHACWINISKGSLELNLKVKISSETKKTMVASLSIDKSLKVKLENIIAKSVSNDSEATLTKDGKLTLTTKIPSLKDETFSLEAGLDPETGLPFAGASISYEFYSYTMKTKYGDLNLSGTVTFKNTFTPMLDNGMCHIYVPAQRAAEQALPYVQGVAVAGGLLIIAPEVAVPALMKTAKKVGPAVLATVGGLLSNSVSAQIKTHKDKEVRNEEKSLIVTFQTIVFEGNKK